MPATIAELLRGKPELVTAKADDRIKDVLAEMIKHDYSQLPVVDDEGLPLGLITCDSIVRALHNFGVSTEMLSVKDAMLRKPPTYYPSDDVFDLLDDLEDSDAVLVIDAQGRLLGIVTTYDTTAYLRQRAQDIMVVREIEEMVKGYINAAFTRPGGDIDTDQQHAAIAEITPSNSSLKGKFSKALAHYLKQTGQASAKIDPDALDAAFQVQLYEQPSVKPFNKLALNEYITLLLHESRWPAYQSIFALDRKAIQTLLEKVRRTRNDLAHFRDDISQAQREELRFAKDWLARHEAAINAAFGIGVPPAPADLSTPAQPDRPARPMDPADPAVSIQDGAQGVFHGPVTIIGRAAAETSANANVRLVPSDEPNSSSDSRYAPLIQMLRNQPIEVERVTLSFGEIDQILGEHRLPESARKYRAWWANTSLANQGHAHAQQWLDAGWRVAGVNMAGERITFARNKEHEQRYLTFFSALRADLERAAPGVFQFSDPDGQYWITIGHGYWENRRVAYFYLAFTRTKRFRVELLIDAGDVQQTKRIYDALLARKEEIQVQVGEALSWERMDDKHSSRIARYYPGQIMDSDGALANLRARVVEATQRFYPVLDRHLALVLPTLMSQRQDASLLPDDEGRVPNHEQANSQ